jgi:Rad3-related DNA helicase
MTTNIMEYFPLPEARGSQKIVLEEIDKVFSTGKNIIILEAPVGSGKSAIAITVAKAWGLQSKVPMGDEECKPGAHIITPRKSLQDQYFEDFSKDIVLMKGRNAYPCTFEVPIREYTAVVTAINSGRIKSPSRDTPNCGDAPCKNDSVVYDECTSSRPCPYSIAMQLAQENVNVVHNLHSFIFQSAFGGKFTKRAVLIVDEAHEIENTVRGFISKKIQIGKVIPQEQMEGYTLKQWEEFFLRADLVPTESELDQAKKINDSEYVSSKEEYLRKVGQICSSQAFEKGFSVEYSTYNKPGTNHPIGCIFEFIPWYVGSAVRNILLNFGHKCLLMSGTIYDKAAFCRNLGISLDEAHFIRIGSSFPKENRPIYLKPKYQVNTSHANWNDNFADLIEVIKEIMEIFKGAKGLIHAPSYAASMQIENALNDARIMSHIPADFLTKLEDFYATLEPRVFISPTCQQGVDFKGDRARFQIVIRVPYPSTSSAFVSNKVKEDFPWYNYQALVVFGQQIGRVNRSEDDYGATFLVDQRFNTFISRNAKILPTWVKEAIVWR